MRAMSKFYTTGTLFAHQGKLKKLPIPSLEETCARFLETAKPLATKTEWEQTSKLISEFQKGAGPVLHKRLLERNERLKQGWLIDWWNDYAYMGYRDPVVVYVNYFFAFADDKTRMAPQTRAASIILGAMQFRDQIETGALAPETTKAGPLCSAQYKYLFNSTRIPKIPSDITRTSSMSENTHIIALRKNQFFRVETLKPNGVRMNMAEMQRQIEHIYETAKETEVAVGALTTENRDVWTKARDELLSISENNRKAFEDIETAAFVICLDEGKPVTKEEHSVACWHGDGRNRFFDKSMQFIVFDNGKAGFNGEHSMMEATITHRACDYICSGLENGSINLGDTTVDLSPLPQKLVFDLNSSVVMAINAAQAQFDNLVSKHDLVVCTYEAYGKELIKTFMVSPDAYAQMALQLAYYKLTGQPAATYESAGTRKFLNGRTEAGRSVSVESVAWTQAMVNPHISTEEKGKLGRLAIKSQSAYMAAAGDGRGVDRHFLGMKMLLEKGEEVPAIYKDPVFTRSSYWKLSTSQVTSEFYDGYGWGEVVPDGYGLAYMVKNNSLQFNIVSRYLKNRHFETYLHEALNEMRIVFSATIPVKAKL